MTEHVLPKRIPVGAFSQSGQLDRIPDSPPALGCAAERPVLEGILLKNQPACPFPGTSWRFLDAFPGTGLLDPAALDGSAFPGDPDYGL